jgi:tetratricopeptide (TPR) repeat protein
MKYQYKQIMIGAVLACLSLCGVACAEATEWDKTLDAGTRAYKRGQYAEAETLLKTALQQAETFGGQDARLATSLNQLAEVYKVQKKYADAEPLYKRCLDIRERTLAPDNMDLLASRFDLAALYYNQGHWDKAESLYKRFLASDEKALGVDHLAVTRDLMNLAGFYYARGRYDQAEPVYERCLASLEKALGPSHPSLVQVLENYAELLRKSNRSAEARSFEARAKAIRQKQPDR